MVNLIFASLLFSAVNAQAPYKCGQKETIKKPYGVVELRVECDYLSDNRYDNISVLEYNGDIQNGISIHFDSLWRKKDSCFFIKEKREGIGLYWDTLGNIIGRETYRNGKQIGRSEYFWAPGIRSNITNYNDSGKEEGLQQVWWRNGNKKVVAEYKNGHIIKLEEYYPTGVLRIKGQYTYEPSRERSQRTIYFETFNPKGKSTGKVVDGNGETWMFDDEFDKKLKRYRVLHEVFKDSLRDSNNEASAKDVAKLMKK